MELTEQPTNLNQEIKSPEREEAHEEGEKQPQTPEYETEEFLETCLLEDTAKGLRVELKSKVLDVRRLTSLAVNSFHWLQSQRTIKSTPSYLG
jgi:hypothetical protein